GAARQRERGGGAPADDDRGDRGDRGDPHAVAPAGTTARGGTAGEALPGRDLVAGASGGAVEPAGPVREGLEPEGVPSGRGGRGGPGAVRAGDLHVVVARHGGLGRGDRGRAALGHRLSGHGSFEGRAPGRGGLGCGDERVVHAARARGGAGGRVVRRGCGVRGLPRLLGGKALSFVSPRGPGTVSVQGGPSDGRTRMDTRANWFHPRPGRASDGPGPVPVPRRRASSGGRAAGLT